MHTLHTAWDAELKHNYTSDPFQDLSLISSVCPIIGLVVTLFYFLSSFPSNYPLPEYKGMCTVEDRI